MPSVPSITNRSKILSACLVLFIFFLPLLSFSQQREAEVKKFSPVLREGTTVKDAEQFSSFVIAVSDTDAFKTFIRNNTRISTIYQYPAVNVFLVRATWKDMREKILPRPEVLFIDEQRKPKEEVAVSNFDINTNKINLLHSRFSEYSGLGLTVSVKENRPDTTDIDLRGRYVATPIVSPTLSAHATIMSTIIAGAGNSYYEGKGVSPGAMITSVNFATLLPEPDAFYQQFNISVQNHSYGTGIENFYGADAAAYDASVIAKPSLVHVFSAGNSGSATSTTGTYAGLPGYANLTGSFKMSKNIITVGHTDSFNVPLPASSRGPAHDGRIKPELVAFGEDGSSGAAAIVSGIALAMQHAYKNLHGFMPSSSLIKAALLNSADDTGPKGIDYSSGFGSPNAYKAVVNAVNGKHFEGIINIGETHTYGIVVPPNTKQLKLTLVWNDPPASANATKALRNDIDLELTKVTSGENFLPWVLSYFPHIDSLQLLPVRKRDSLNNAEQISIDNPVSGDYLAKIKVFSIPGSGSQSYSVAYQFDTLDKFYWYYPTRTDNIFAGTSNVLRWESNFSNTIGQLDYSIDNGSSWQTINNTVDLTKGYYKWTAPDTFVTALLRMNFSAQNFVSDTVTISKRFNTYVGFNCPDSFLFYWNKQPAVNSYEVFRLGPKYMEPFVVTNDTAVILGKPTNPSLYYAVAPVINNKRGVRSYAFDYTTQGVGCYIVSFFAQLSGNTGVLDLVLGTNYMLKIITWEKFTTGGYIGLQTISNFPGLSYSHTDNSLSYGANTYRVKIELQDGRIIYSQPETLYYFGNRPHIVYPNPAPQYQPVTVLSEDPGSTHMEIFNSIGAKVHEARLNDLINTIPGGKLSKGFYILRMTKDNQAVGNLKLVIH